MKAENAHVKGTLKRLAVAGIAASALAVPTAIVTQSPASAAAACDQPHKDRQGMDTHIVTSCYGDGQVTMTASCPGNTKTWTWYEKIGSNKEFTLKNCFGTGKVEISYG